MISPTDPTYPAFPIFSFLGFVLVLIPLSWHFQAWNSGTCLFMIWTSLSCFIGFVNSLVWANTIDDVAPVWCDISTRLIVGIAVAIPAASLCINRRLYKIASSSTVSISKAEKRRAVLVDLAIGLGIPFVQMPLQFIVQGHRYDILENVGCYPTTYNVVPAYPLSYLWPNIINLISAGYVVLTLRAFLQRRAQFASLLSSTLPALTPNRYFRLMALASLELVLNLPLATYGLYLTASRSPIAPWVSWADTHADFFAINQVPALFWRADAHTQATVELSRWAGVICALAFFAFFGFAAEARKHYRLAFWAPHANAPSHVPSYAHTFMYGKIRIHYAPFPSLDAFNFTFTFTSIRCTPPATTGLNEIKIDITSYIVMSLDSSMPQFEERNHNLS
ncbi:pheromone receptor [Mycena polygramma]|nr:pheromone receptor [Mycena polygramma]